MPPEIEIKLRISDTNAFLLALKRLGARPLGRGTGRVHESNVLFDTPEGDLGKRGQLLRIRTQTAEAMPATAKRKSSTKSGTKSGTKSRRAPEKHFLLTFKRPLAASGSRSAGAQENHRHKVREELELEVTDSAALSRIFEGLGMRGWFRYEKRRTTFRLPSSSTWAKDLLIELDETPIGTFVELEGPPTAIDLAARKLGFSPQDYILENYLALCVEDCRRRGVEPTDMVFGPAK